MEILTPKKIGNMCLKNRVLMAPMATGGLSDFNGGFGERAKDYYVARARGGTAMIITGSTGVSTAIEGKGRAVNKFFLDSRKKISPLSEMADEIHYYGSKLCVQLSTGGGRLGGALPDMPFPPVSASAVPAFFYPDTLCRPLTVKEIDMIVKAFGDAAAICRDAGVDAIEIHGYGGYLVDQFMSAVWNKREDEYGGDLQGRMRFPLQLIAEVKKACGDDFPILFKFSPKHYFEGGRDIEEGLEIARILEKKGVAALHVDKGSYETWYYLIPPIYQPPACQIEVAEAVKKVVKIPVIAHGKLGYPELAESVLIEGKADFIALGRSLLADPDWVKKVEEKRLEDITPCIGCHECMLRSQYQGKYISCAVNPTCGKEKAYQLTPASSTKSVLVIGGGPGGLEAAITAAYRGYKVELWERSAKLGGNLNVAMVPEFKRDLRRLVQYLITQVYKRGVNVRLLKEASAEEIIAEAPDAVIIASGSEPFVPDLPGIKRENVYTPVEVLEGKKETGNRVVVVGGGLVGCETGVFLAQQGKKVTIIEMLDRLMADPPPEEIVKMNIQKMITEAGIDVYTNTELLRVGEGHLDVKGEEKEYCIECDSIVLAIGFNANDPLKDELSGKLKKVTVIGDAVKPRRVIDAVWEGFHAARLL